MISDLQEQETILKQCISQLESVDVARISLINQLKEALIEQVLCTLSLSFKCSISVTYDSCFSKLSFLFL